jgi:D-aspartate ligase
MSPTPIPTSRTGNSAIAAQDGSEVVGAIVIGGDHPGLGIARSLGRRSIPVCIIDDQRSASHFSRYAAQVVRVKDLRDERKTVDTVIEIGKRYGYRGWVLYPTRDETVAAFARHHDRLAKYFRVTTQPWEITKWALDKANIYQLATELGIPSPQTHIVKTEAELPELYTRLPLAIKPAMKENFFYATGAKAWRANTPEELHDYFQKAAGRLKTEEILLQEIIPGGGSQQYSYCAFWRNGIAQSTLVARRLRQHPREFGRAATYVETLDHPGVEHLSERFLKAIDFYGIVEIEYKLDPRDGKLKLLDVNARTWGFHGIGIPAGVDFPYLLYADQIGKAVSPSRGRTGVGWIRTITDVPTALSDLLSSELKLSAYWNSLRNTRAESTFSLRDPLPSVAEILLLPYLMMKKGLVKS